MLRAFFRARLTSSSVKTTPTDDYRRFPAYPMRSVTSFLLRTRPAFNIAGSQSVTTTIIMLRWPCRSIAPSTSLTRSSPVSVPACLVSSGEMAINSRSSVMKVCFTETYVWFPLSVQLSCVITIFFPSCMAAILARSDFSIFRSSSNVDLRLSNFVLGFKIC